MVKRSRQPHRKQTKSELRRKKKASHTAFQHQADFVHPSIKAAWDKRRTLEQNYVALGLAADPNDRRQRQRQSERLAAVDIDASEEQLRVSLLTRKRKREGLEEREGEMEEGERDEGEEGEEEDDGGATAVSSTPAARQLHEELREVQKLGDKARPYQVKSMSLNEQRRLQRLIAKFGDDVERMARDVSLNLLQETASQLRKRIALYHRLQLA